MSWMPTDTFPDDDQSDILKKVRDGGAHFIRGHAGSGKTVLLVYAIRHEQIENPHKTIGVVLYTHALIDLVKTGMAELNVQNIDIMTYPEFSKKINRHYDILFIDEIQDFSEQAIREFQQYSNQLIIAGDTQQSIYDTMVGIYPSQKVISGTRISSVANAREHTLATIYRLTISILKAAGIILNIDLMFSKTDATKRDTKPRLKHAISKSDEIQFVWNEAKQHAANSGSTAILIPTQRGIVKFANEILNIEGKSKWDIQWGQRKGNVNFEIFNNYVNAHGVKMEYVGNRRVGVNALGSIQHAEKNHNVILMTYHSAKGLDFENVFMPLLTPSLFIATHAPETVFFVAMTRSRGNVYFSYTGSSSHPYLQKIEATCSNVDLGVSANDDSDNIDIYDF